MKRPTLPPRVRIRARSRSQRRLRGALTLLIALVGFGFLFSVVTPAPREAEAGAVNEQQIAAGAAIYSNSCITCHGSNLQGVQDRGPSLIGVGQAATYFQVATGRMPLADNGAQAPRKEPIFDPLQIQALGAYIQANGGGPQVDVAEDGTSATIRDNAAVAKGAELYRLNCASCHNFTGKGGALSQGKYAPDLGPATDSEIYAAMLSGPENMPKFSDGQLTPDEKVAIVTYVQSAKASMDPGGYGLGGFGPVSEGFFAFIVGMGLIVGVMLWMGASRVSGDVVNGEVSTTDTPTSEELRAMSRDELARLGAKLDGVDLVEYGPRYVPGSPADKNAERAVAKWFVLTGLFGVLTAITFIWWPQQYKTWDDPDQWVYALYNPLLGLTLGLTILCLGVGVVGIARRLMPHELAVQQRHDGLSEEIDRLTLAGELTDVGDKSGLIKRRGMLKGSLLLAGGGLTVAAAVPVLGGFVKNPWAEGDESQLWITPWAPAADGTKVRLVQQDGTPVRPSDMGAGAMITVFPGVPGGAKASDAPVMLFRLRSNEPVKFRDAAHETYRFGDYYAYSKICTHVGCPVSLYEQQTGRILCPCHQSQFDVNDGARPVFGPAGRPLPQLPITVDDEGYFIATSDFTEPVGPGFWENKGRYES